MSGGLVGIINNSTICTKWCLTCNDKIEIVDQVQSLLWMKTSDYNNNDEEDNPTNYYQASWQRDKKLCPIFQFRKYQVLSRYDTLLSMVTGDVATNYIADSLIQHSKYGHEHLKTFVEERLISRISSRLGVWSPFIIMNIGKNVLGNQFKAS